MNKKVILIRTLNELTNSSMTSGPRRPEQLSLSYLASSLEDAGFETIILSGDVSKSDLFQCIDKNEPFAVCFSIYTYTCNASLFLARQAKARSGKKYPLITVFGGYHASTLPEEIAAKKEVDFVVKGEGDITLKELLTTLYEKKDPVDIPGLCFRKNGKILHTSKRERIINIDNILFPKDKKSILIFLKGLNWLIQLLANKFAQHILFIPAGVLFLALFVIQNSLGIRKYFSDRLFQFLMK